MYILKSISAKDIEQNNKALIKEKILKETKAWQEKVLLGKDDHRFNQGVYCTLLDILEIL